MEWEDSFYLRMMASYLTPAGYVVSRKMALGRRQKKEGVMMSRLQQVIIDQKLQTMPSGYGSLKMQNLHFLLVLIIMSHAINTLQKQ